MEKSTFNIKDIKPKRFDLDDYELGSTLGTGSFGRVRISKNKESSDYYAIKSMKKQEIIKMKQVDHIMNEIKILSAIDHPFIVNI